jgi:hypothetical protein
MGYPSQVVIKDDGVPGMFMRMAVMRPPDMPPTYIETRSASPTVGAMEKVKGIIKVTHKTAVSPGMAPKIMPINIPRTITTHIIGVPPNT